MARTPGAAERWWTESGTRLAALQQIAADQQRTLSGSIAADLSGARSALARTIAWSLAVLVGVLTLGLLLRRSIARSLAELSRGARALSAGDLSTEIRSSGHDEIAAVGDAFRGIRVTNRRLLGELRSMNAAIAQGNLGHRADPATFDGAWADVLEGMNGTMVEVARLHDAASREVARQRAFGLVGRQVVAGIPVEQAYTECSGLIVDHVGALRVEIYEQTPDGLQQRELEGAAAPPLPADTAISNVDEHPSTRADAAFTLMRVIGDVTDPRGALVVEFGGDHGLAAGDLLFVDGVARLLSEAVRFRDSEDEMRYRVLHDPLTGLPNRTMFVEHLDSALARATRSGEGVAVLFLDLDAFKIVNDSLGHAVGDELLVGVSRRLLDVVRGGDLVARLGGDEFVVVTERLASPGDAHTLAERLLTALRTPFELAGRDIYTTISVGIAISTPPYLGSGAALLQQADTAMYRAKRGGGGRVEQFDEALRTTVVRRMDLEHRLRAAVQRHELDVFFQPLVDLHTRETIGFEALARWSDPEIGNVAPDEFIAIAEETQLIVDLGLDALRQSCDQFATFLRSDEASTTVPYKVAVNVSVRQLQHPGFVEQLIALRDEWQVRPGALAIEVTESVLLDDTPIVRDAINRLSDAEVPIAIDDFGTGYSSFANLTQLPLSTLKIKEINRLGNRRQFRS